MRPYIRITFITFTVWLLASLVNGVLSGIFLSIAERQPSEWAGDISTVVFISLVLSVPGFFIFWISIMVSFAKRIRARVLFRTALSAGFILAVLTGFMCSGLFSNAFCQKYVFMLFIAISAITSVMLHFKHFIKIK